MIKDLKHENLNFFRFKEIHDNKYLLTNDSGNFITLEKEIFETLRDDPENLSEDVQSKLYDLGFINSEEKNEEIIKTYREKNKFLQIGPSLHIVVVTLRCDHKCVYCHASRKDMDSTEFDMDIKTAEKTVDFILKTTSKSICIEFQGGEPLINFEAIKHIIEYVESKNSDKTIIFSVVTNLSLMDDEKLNFFIKHDVSICTSLDGTEKIHNKNRVLKDGNSFENTVSWIKKINSENLKKDESLQKYNRLNALLTVSKDLSKQYKEVIDLYIDLGFNSIHLRPLNPFGYGQKLTKDFYSADDFNELYKNSLDYILSLNKSGTNFYEKTAQIILKKIISKVDSNYLDLRSPCGAGIGQLAYNYDGNIFTCDEGRMLSETGDDTFLLGNINETSYTDVIRNETTRALCIASCLEGLTGCNDCAYNPYCGVCPIYNYVEQGNIFGHMPTNDRCKIYMAVQDYLFSKMDDYYEIFTNWTDSI